MRSLPLRCGLVIVNALLLTSVITAQLKVDVALVNVVATVTDDRGHYVEGLTTADFVVEEDGAPQTIAHFEQSKDVPVSLGILLDSSLSMQSKIKTATDAVTRFIRTIHKDDDIFLLTFDHTPTLRQDFTDNRDKLITALGKVKLGAGTALYDALDQSLRKVKEGRHDNKALLLITDGEDVGSRLSEAEVESRVKESSVLLYALGIGAERSSVTSTHPTRRPSPPPVRGPVPGIRLPGGISIPIPGTRHLTQAPARTRFPGRDSVNVNVLNGLADSSGGKAWTVSGSSSSREIDKALDEIALELRNQYNIGYYPTHALKDGKWHRIDIRTKNDKYNVRARDEYFGG